MVSLLQLCWSTIQNFSVGKSNHNEVMQKLSKKKKIKMVGDLNVHVEKGRQGSESAKLKLGL